MTSPACDGTCSIVILAVRAEKLDTRRINPFLFINYSTRSRKRLMCSLSYGLSVPEGKRRLTIARCCFSFHCSRLSPMWSSAAQARFPWPYFYDLSRIFTFLIVGVLVTISIIYRGARLLLISVVMIVAHSSGLLRVNWHEPRMNVSAIIRMRKAYARTPKARALRGCGGGSLPEKFWNLCFIWRHPGSFLSIITIQWTIIVFKGGRKI